MITDMGVTSLRFLAVYLSSTQMRSLLKRFATNTRQCISTSSQRLNPSVIKIVSRIGKRIGGNSAVPMLRYDSL